MVRISYITLLLSMSIFAWSQNPPEIEDIKKELLQESISDSLRGELYLQLASSYLYMSKDSFLFYTQLSLENFKKIDYTKGIARTYISLGNVHASSNNIDSSEYYLSMAEHMISPDDDDNLVFLYFNYAFLNHNITNQYDKAISYYLQAIEVAKRLDDSTKLAAFHYNIADIFGQNDMIEKAFPHNVQALQYSKNSNLQSLKSIVLYGIGMYYFDNEVYDSSGYYFKKSLDQTDLDNNYSGAFYAYNGLSETLREQGDYEEAYQLALKAYSYAVKMNVQYELALANCKLSSVSILSGRIMRGDEAWQRYLDINEGMNNVYVAEECLRIRAETLGEKGFYRRAFASMTDYIVLKDSVFSKENRSIIADLEEKYQSENKQLEIEKQKLTLGVYETQKRSIIGGALFLLIFSIGVISHLVQRGRKNKLIYNQENQLKKQRIVQLEKEKEIMGMNAMIKGQEAERTRIAKDLHDGLGGLLSTVKAHFGNIQSDIQKLEKMNIYDRVNNLVDEACHEVRRISHNLMPNALRLGGLKVAIEDLAQYMDEAHPFDVTVELIDLTMRMSESNEVFNYRIIQEVMNNIIKHANASHVLIQLSESQDEFHFIIEDDGVGFNPHTIEQGLGIKSIQSRVKYLNGHFDIHSRINEGTTLSWSIPKEDRPKEE